MYCNNSFVITSIFSVYFHTTRSVGFEAVLFTPCLYISAFYFPRIPPSWSVVFSLSFTFYILLFTAILDGLPPTRTVVITFSLLLSSNTALVVGRIFFFTFSSFLSFSLFSVFYFSFQILVLILTLDQLD